MRVGRSNREVMDAILFTLGGTIHRWHEPVNVSFYTADLRFGRFEPPLNARDLTPRDTTE